ncbi:MAG TPA: DUF6352 family protein [Casimicrobiaceae bacterium]|nr:DUF6352 family protein [Casimicrobiaceae bacterium]
MRHQACALSAIHFSRTAATTLPDFWRSCGYRLLTTGGDGRLTLTDDFLRSLLLRPELAPVAGSGPAELRLHDALLALPRRAVAATELAAIEDPDARDNYTIFLRFRDRLMQAPSIEAAYARLFGSEGVDVPPLFVAQLTQILLRHILGEDADPLEARAAEMLFRPQKIAVLEDGAVMAADATTVERFATTGGFGSLGELLARQKTPLRTLDLDVLDEHNATEYWLRDERFDLAVSLNRGRVALSALTQVLVRWIAHFLHVEVTLEARREIDDKQWVWHVGLDAQASGILNDLYNEQDVEEDRLARLLCLFELRFADPSVMRPQIAGRPVYLAMAMDADQVLKLKPQNLLLNLPLARLQ